MHKTAAVEELRKKNMSRGYEEPAINVDLYQTPARQFTPRQIRLREIILSEARALITANGYEGVNMRDLARHAKVTPKTLYYQFGSKEQLLRTAVEEMFHSLYTAIDAERVAKGFDRLLFIIDRVADLTREHWAYAKAAMPIFTQTDSSTFTTIRKATYRRAIDQIHSEGDFQHWVDIGLVSGLIDRQVNPIYQAPWLSHVSLEVTNQVTKHDIALLLAAVTTGYTHDRAIETGKAMQRELSGSPYL